MSDHNEGEECPIPRCDAVIGDGHYVADTPGAHTYHTDKRGTARLWEHRDGLDVTPSTEPYGIYTDE